MSIYETYGALMLRRCRLITRDPDLAAEAFQDSFIKVIRFGSDFRKLESKLRWLYTHCDRACFRLLEKRSHNLKDGYVLDVLDDVDDIGIRLENRKSVTEFWNDLDDQEKQIAVLKYVDGLSPTQTGDVVGLTVETVERKIERIRRKADAIAGVDSNE